MPNRDSTIPTNISKQLLEEEQSRDRCTAYGQKVGEAIDADQWTSVPEENQQEFWNGIRQKAEQLRDACATEVTKCVSSSVPVAT